jgi:hypothetical protein
MTTNIKVSVNDRFEMVQKEAVVNYHRIILLGWRNTIKVG